MAAAIAVELEDCSGPVGVVAGDHLLDGRVNCDRRQCADRPSGTDTDHSLELMPKVPGTTYPDSAWNPIVNRRPPCVTVSA